MIFLRTRLGCAGAVGALAVALAVLWISAVDSSAASRGRHVSSAEAVPTGTLVGPISAASEVAPKPPSFIPVGKVKTDGLRLRSHPSLNGTVKGLLFSGDKVAKTINFHPTFNKSWVGIEVLTTRGGLPYRTKGYISTAYVS